MKFFDDILEHKCWAFRHLKECVFNIYFLLQKLFERLFSSTIK